jgi:hypothetical protein
MITEMKSDLKKNGFIVIQGWYYFIGLAIMLGGLAIGIGKTLEAQSDTDAEVETLITWKDKHIDEVSEIRIALENRLATIESETKAINDKLDWIIKNIK